jgi:hypothetical protein
MAYRSTRRFRRKLRRYVTGKGSENRLRPRSRYTAKTRRYTKRRPMSRKRILNIASQKKRDKMLTYTNVNASSQTGGTTYAQVPAIITGGSGTPFVAVWCSTARDNVANSTGRVGTKFDQACRTASLCYMVGLKEVIEVQVADGLPWQWRRICFALKGGSTASGNLPGASTSFAVSQETSAGWVRTFNGLTQTQQNNFFALLFQGALNSDWNDPLTAKVDTERVSLKYDKVCTIASGNEDGVIRKYNRWHPMRKNLMYDDDESGGTTGPSGYSTNSRIGMGDYWVIDIIKPRVGSTSANQLLFNLESTLYWHER